MRKGKGRREEERRGEKRVWILNKTEAARCLFEPVQSHDDPLHISAHWKKLIDLFLRCVKWKITHIQCRACTQLLIIFFFWKLCVCVCGVYVLGCAPNRTLASSTSTNFLDKGVQGFPKRELTPARWSLYSLATWLIVVCSLHSLVPGYSLAMTIAMTLPLPAIIQKGAGLEMFFFC